MYGTPHREKVVIPRDQQLNGGNINKLRHSVQYQNKDPRKEILPAPDEDAWHPNYLSCSHCTLASCNKHTIAN